MKRKILILGFFLIPLLLVAQFEQKVSINLTAGMFKTFGEKYGNNENGEPRPKQMPSYKAGIASELGFQYNINRRFSILAEVGIMYSNKWELIGEDGEYNWMYWTIDTVHFSEGFNKLNLLNLSIGIIPKLYFLPGKKLNPFIYAGININYTHAKYTDNQWLDYLSRGLAENPEEDNPWLRKNIGFGFNPGLGIEYNPSEKISVFLTAGYYHIFLNKKNFAYYYPERRTDFKAFQIQAGIRYSFIKSKNL